jgi:copper(I)-binding protein
MTITVSQSPRLNEFYLSAGVSGGAYGIAEGAVLIDPVTGLAYNSAQQYVWDTNALAWVKMTQPGAGGGGGAATIADGADIAEGATTDVAVSTDANGTVSAKLRGIIKNQVASMGFNIPANDYVSLAQDATHDTYTFKSGGAGGTTVATKTITYTDATKVTISTIVRT